MQSFLALAEYHFGLSKGLIAPGTIPLQREVPSDRPPQVVRTKGMPQQVRSGYSDEQIRQQEAQETGQ